MFFTKHKEGCFIGVSIFVAMVVLLGGCATTTPAQQGSEEAAVEGVAEKELVISIHGTAKLFEGTSCSTNDLEDTVHFRFTVPPGQTLDWTIVLENKGLGGGDTAEIAMAVSDQAADLGSRLVVASGSIQIVDDESFGSDEHNSLIFSEQAIISDIQPRKLAQVDGCAGGEVRVELDVNVIGDPCVAYAITNQKHRLAEYYAPVIHQDTNDDCYECDFIMKVNYDNDYDLSNNWNHLDQNLDDNGLAYDKGSYVYYAVSETDTHYFLGYYFFHPRDWGIEPCYPPFSSEHENDLEGVTVVVRKAGANQFGGLVAMETLAHDQFYQFVYCPDSNGNGKIDTPNDGQENDATIKTADRGENVDGCMMVYTSATETACNAEMSYGCIAGESRSLDLPADQIDIGVHPMVFIESNGHGVGACAYEATNNACDVNCDTPDGRDGIIYYYGSEPQIPSTGAGSYTEMVSYDLIPMDAGSGDPTNGTENQGLWKLRNREEVFRWFGVLQGDEDDTCGDGELITCTSNSAKAPWGWDDGDDNQVYVGDMLCDPAFTFDTHLDGEEFENYKYHYVDHVYYTHHILLDSVLTTKEDDDDIYIDVEASFDSGSELGGKFMGEDNWKKDDAGHERWYDWYHGGFDSTGPQNYSNRHGNRHICRPSDTEFTIQPMDSDDGSDDALGPEHQSPYPVISLDDMGKLIGHVYVRYAISENSNLSDPAPNWEADWPSECNVSD